MGRRLSLVVLLLATLLSAGCRTPVVPPSEPVVVSVLYNERKDTPFKADWRIIEEYKTRQNVVLDVRTGDDAAFDKALVRTFESGDIPDVILKVWPQSVESYANAGQLLPISDYTSLMPNFTAYIAKHSLQGELDKLKLSNGKYYVLPGYKRKIQVQQWIYRRDVFAANGLAAPTTYEELFDDLVLLKKRYPASTPITASWGGAHLLAMMGAGYGIPAGWAGTTSYDAAANVWKYAPATDNYKALYTFLNRCYIAGILDPAVFTQTEADFTRKLTDGSALVTVTWITSGFDTWNGQLKANGIAGGEWAALRVPVSTIGLRALPAVDPYRKGLAVSSSVVDKPYFKQLIAFLDWAVYSEEGMTLTTWGVEGLTFENTASGKAFLPAIVTPKNPAGTVNITAEYGFDSMFNLNEDEEFEDYKKPAGIVTFLDASLKANETAAMNPQLNLGTDAVEAIRIVNEKLAPYVAESSTKFITGELSISNDWNRYLQELGNRGYRTLEKVWNDA